MVVRSTPFRVIRLAAGPRDPQDGDAGAQGGDRQAQEDRRTFHDLDEAPGELAELGLDHIQECEDDPDRGVDEPAQKNATFPAHGYRFAAATAFFYGSRAPIIPARWARDMRTVAGSAGVKAGPARPAATRRSSPATLYQPRVVTDSELARCCSG